MKRFAISLVLLCSFLMQGQTTQTPQPQSTQPAKSTTKPLPSYHKNNNAQRVKSESPFIPAGATARCRDGSWSFSHHRQGTCSHHGGVVGWLVY